MIDPTIIDFEKGDGLVPAIIQDEHSGVVLMLGYMNRQALQVTLDTGKVTFFSRSKQRLWTKGEASGHFLLLKSILLDCDQDTLLIKANPVGPTCHTGQDTCFNEVNHQPFLRYLETVIQNRYQQPLEGSYTSKLFEKGINKIAQKVGEEAVELVIEAKDQNDDRFLNEAADLMYHLLVLLTYRGKQLADVETVLKHRHQ